MALKRAVVGIVAAAVAASVIGAAPAQAGPGDPVGCLPDPQVGDSPAGVVEVNGFDVTVHPQNAPSAGFWVAGTALGLAFDGLIYFWCVDNGTSAPVWCAGRQVQILPNGEPYYVTQDPDSGSITVHGSQLVSDLTVCREV